MCHQMHYLDLQQLDRWFNGCSMQEGNDFFFVPQDQGDHTLYTKQKKKLSGNHHIVELDA